jgi:type IV secretion system protein VirB9
MTIRASLIACLALAAASGAHAQITATPLPGPGDPRIRQVTYNPDQIVPIRAHLGYELTIEFDPSERIENVSIGDSLSWQVTPNRKATLLFIKPMAATTPTSMTVATDRRIYSFVLTAVEGPAKAGDSMLRLRFLYPPPPAPPPAPAEPPPAPPSPDSFNFSYTYKGAKPLYPVRVFDDGQATFFEFVQGKDTPAVFVIGVDGKEEMANTRISGRYTVADIVAERFVLRYGKAKSEIRNTAWREPVTSSRSSPPPAAALPPAGG